MCCGQPLNALIALAVRLQVHGVLQRQRRQELLRSSFSKPADLPRRLHLQEEGHCYMWFAIQHRPPIGVLCKHRPVDLARPMAGRCCTLALLHSASEKYSKQFPCAVANTMQQLGRHSQVCCARAQVQASAPTCHTISRLSFRTCHFQPT
jgi:hypothetical protein